MRRKPGKKHRQTKVFIKANSQVRYPEVRVLSETGDMLGIMSSRDAFFKAQELGKDLVLVTEKSEVPIVKIIELSKFKYQLQQKASQDRKSAKQQDQKEIRLKPFMAENDFESKLKKIVAFLEKGHKVRIEIQFKGRQITKKEFGFQMIDKVLEATQDIAQVEIQPKLMGMKLMTQLMPGNKNKS